MTEYEKRVACVEIYAAAINADTLYSTSESRRRDILSYKNGIKTRTLASVEGDYRILMLSNGYAEARRIAGYVV